MEGVRERTLEVLGEIVLDPKDPLLAGGFVYEMLLAHEYQHNETMLQLLQMVESYRAGRDRRSDRRPSPSPTARRWSRWRPARTRSAPRTEGFAYDNERPRHRVELDEFWIDRTPVTNGAYIRFIEETAR